MANVLDAEVLLDGGLIAAEHGSPVKGATDNDAPEAVSHRWAWVHVEELEASGEAVIFEHGGPAALFERAPDDDQQERADKYSRLERVRHYHGFHTTLWNEQSNCFGSNSLEGDKPSFGVY